MAKLLKFFLFVLLLGFLAYIFVYIGELDDKPEETEITDVDVVKAYGDSLALIAADDTVSKTMATALTSAFEDFTVRLYSYCRRRSDSTGEKSFSSFRKKCSEFQGIHSLGH